MTHSFLSIPGLPSTFASLDSKIYHDYGAILKVVKSSLGNDDIEVHEYVWPKEVKKNELSYYKTLKIPAYYLYYNLDAEYRRKVVDLAKENIKKATEGKEMTFLILHSHGNRVAFDALLELKSEMPELLERIVVLSFAPAYRNVLRGIVPPGLTQEEIKEIDSSVHALLSFRMRKDVLSGDPELENTFFFDPKFYEYVFLGHATIRSREDVMQVLSDELAKILK